MRRLFPVVAALLLGAAPALAQIPRNGSGGGSGRAPPPAVHPGAKSGGATQAASSAGAGTGAVAFASPGAAQSSGFVDLGEARFEFHARDLPVSEVFAQLRKVTRKNILLQPGADALFTGDLFDVTTEDCLRLVCKTTGLSWRQEGAFFIVERPQIESRVFTLDYARAADVVPFLDPLLGPGGSVTATSPAQVGISTSAESSGGNEFANHDLLLVQALPDHMQKIAEVVSQLDAEPVQVLIEATILAVKMNDAFELGVQWKALLGQDFQDVGAASSDGTTLNNFGFDTDQVAAGAGTASTTFANRLVGGLNVGLFKKSINVLIHALESVTKVRILANPRVLVLNKQRGEVLLGRRDGYLTTTVTMTSSTQSVAFLETGTRLVFRPYVSRNGMVRLEIHPEDSNGGLNDKGLPFKDTTEVTTNIMVPDGGTVVIGGLFREHSQEIEDSVPFLGKIPILGYAFRSKHQESRREEVVVVLKPHVLLSSTLAASPAQQVKAIDESAARSLGGSLSEAWTRQAEQELGAKDAAASWFFLEQAPGGARAPRSPGFESLRAQAGNELLQPPAGDALKAATDAALAKSTAPAPASGTPKWFLLDGPKARAAGVPAASVLAGAPASAPGAQPSLPAATVDVDPVRDFLRGSAAPPLPAGWSGSRTKERAP